MAAETRNPPQGRFKRLLWFMLIYVASLVAFTAVVYGLRAIIPR